MTMSTMTNDEARDCIHRRLKLEIDSLQMENEACGVNLEHVETIARLTRFQGDISSIDEEMWSEFAAYDPDTNVFKRKLLDGWQTYGLSPNPYISLTAYLQALLNRLWDAEH